MSFAVITHYASDGIQHQFCRLDHMCKEFLAAHCGKKEQQSLQQQIMQTVYKYQKSQKKLQWKQEQSQ